MDALQDDSLKQRVRKARARFAAMAATYFAGVLNDNLFRQTILLMAVAAGKSFLQSVAMFLFTLPFILFAAPAGYCADRFSKRSIVIASKLLELVAMVFAAAGIYSLNWSLMLVTLFIMALQATIFNPALNGTIPELYPAEYIITANGIVRMVSTGAILAGTALAGVVLDVKGTIGAAPAGRAIAAFAVVGIAVAGLIVSFGVPRFPAASPGTRFPWSGPVDTLRTLWQVRSDSLLAVTIAANAFFWMVGALQIQVINQLGLAQFGLTNTMTSAMLAVEMTGIAVGSLLATRLAKGDRWYRVLVPAAAVMAVSMFTIALVPHLPAPLRRSIVVISLGLLGAAGGVYSVPLSSFVQIRPAPNVKGKIIAVANFADWSGILVSSGLFYLLNRLKLRPSNCYAVMGLMTIAVMIWLFLVLPRSKSNA